jgi:hypothetical protein
MSNLEFKMIERLEFLLVECVGVLLHQYQLIRSTDFVQLLLSFHRRGSIYMHNCKDLICEPLAVFVKGLLSPYFLL